MSITGHPGPGDAGLVHEADASDARTEAGQRGVIDARAGEAAGPNGAGGSGPKTTNRDAASAPFGDAEVTAPGDDADTSETDAPGCACRASRGSHGTSGGPYAFIGLAIAQCLRKTSRGKRSRRRARPDAPNGSGVASHLSSSSNATA